MTHHLTKPSWRLAQPHFRHHTTLLDLVWALNQVTADTHKTVVMAARLINRGHAQLTGTFKGTRQIRV